MCVCACVRVCYLISAERPRKHIFTILPYLHILKGSKLKSEHVCKRILYRGKAGLCFFVCALGSPFILTSGLASRDGRTSVFLFSWNLEGSTLCDIEVKTHVYLLTGALTKAGNISVPFFPLLISGHLQIFKVKESVIITPSYGGFVSLLQ
jgi:hypothetical protein